MTPIPQNDELRKLVAKCFFDELMETEHDDWSENSIEYFDIKQVIDNMLTLLTAEKKKLLEGLLDKEKMFEDESESYVLSSDVKAELEKLSST